MIGSLFAGHEESPGKTVEVDGKLFKEYYGSASDFNKGEYKHVEGKRILEPIKGKLADTLREMQRRRAELDLVRRRHQARRHPQGQLRDPGRRQRRRAPADVSARACGRRDRAAYNSGNDRSRQVLRPRRHRGALGPALGRERRLRADARPGASPRSASSCRRRTSPARCTWGTRSTHDHGRADALPPHAGRQHALGAGHRPRRHRHADRRRAPAAGRRA